MSGEPSDFEVDAVAIRVSISIRKRREFTSFKRNCESTVEERIRLHAVADAKREADWEGNKWQFKHLKEAWLQGRGDAIARHLKKVQYRINLETLQMLKCSPER